MLKRRIIPVLMYNKDFMCVQSVKFQRPHRIVGSLMQNIEVMESRNIDELILLDVDAPIYKYDPRFDKLKEFTSKLFCPVTYGGGIMTMEHIREALNSGADKVSINTWLDDEMFIKRAVNKYGAQCITASIDVSFIASFGQYVKGVQSTLDAINLGVGEILLTSIDNNGVMGGYDLDMIYDFNYLTRNEDNVPPLIINGGCGEPEHMAKAFDAGADAVAASSIFLFTDFSPRVCASTLLEQGYSVRLDDLDEDMYEV